MKPKGFIFGGYVNGLWLARSLAKENIQSYVFDVEKRLAGYSKTATYVKSPDPQESDKFVEFVIKFSKKQKLKPVCFITNDVWLTTLLKIKET